MIVDKVIFPCSSNGNLGIPGTIVKVVGRLARLLGVPIVGSSGGLFGDGLGAGGLILLSSRR